MINKLIYYPPSSHKLRRLFGSYAIAISILLGIAYAYRVYLRDIFPDWASLLIVFVVLLVVLWIYRIEKIWYFCWNDCLVTISFKYNLFMVYWIKIDIGGVPVTHKSAFMRMKPININSAMKYSEKHVPMMLSIRRTADTNAPECALMFEEKTLVGVNHPGFCGDP